jgi:hypothetical protein
MKYKVDYTHLHETGNFFYGYSLLPSKERIYQIIKDTNSETVLDYGSGKGMQYSKRKVDLYWGVEVDCYDPGYKPFSVLPDKTYDGVICTEVMEHIPEDEVDQALREIFDRARKFVFFTISLNLSNVDGGKTLLDGTNLHVTIKTEDWWNEKIRHHNKNNIAVQTYFSIPKKKSR